MRTPVNEVVEEIARARSMRRAAESAQRQAAMMERRAIQQLLDAGHSYREIEKLTGIKKSQAFKLTSGRGVVQPPRMEPVGPTPRSASRRRDAELEQPPVVVLAVHVDVDDASLRAGVAALLRVPVVGWEWSLDDTDAAFDEAVRCARHASRVEGRDFAVVDAAAREVVVGGALARLAVVRFRPGNTGAPGLRKKVSEPP